MDRQQAAEFGSPEESGLDETLSARIERLRDHFASDAFQDSADLGAGGIRNQWSQWNQFHNQI